jgi:hypothetical protein
MNIQDTNEVLELLTDIQEWMVENDYECGPVGSDIYTRISDFLKNLDDHE